MTKVTGPPCGRGSRPSCPLLTPRSTDVTGPGLGEGPTATPFPTLPRECRPSCRSQWGHPPCQGVGAGRGDFRGFRPGGLEAGAGSPVPVSLLTAHLPFDGRGALSTPVHPWPAPALTFRRWGASVFQSSESAVQLAESRAHVLAQARLCPRLEPAPGPASWFPPTALLAPAFPAPLPSTPTPALP